MGNTRYHLLQKLENQLNSQVDNNPFQDHKQFHSPTRIINVLGAKFLDEAANNNNTLNTLNSMLCANQSDLSTYTRTTWHKLR